MEWWADTDTANVQYVLLVKLNPFFHISNF